MLIFHQIISAISAVIVLLFVVQIIVALANLLRERDYKRFENISATQYESNFPCAGDSASVSDALYQCFAPFVNEIHKDANNAQTKYHNTVARLSGCLGLGFAILAFDVLHSGDGNSAISNRAELVENFANWLDTVALIAVLVLFLRGRRAGKRWIVLRARSELLRQYQILCVLFPGALPSYDSTNAKGAFEAELKISGVLRADSIKQLTRQIEQIWSDRKQHIEKHSLTVLDLSPDAVSTYLRRRSRRQLIWFSDSKSRLEYISERRGKFLMILYCTSVLLSALKLGLALWHHRTPEVVLPLLLMATGMSATMTAYYINQNSRSLIHRYNSQCRSIVKWLMDFQEKWSFERIPFVAFSAPDRTDIRVRVLAFEGFMISELLDWIHITNNDSIELAP